MKNYVITLIAAGVVGLNTFGQDQPEESKTEAAQPIESQTAAQPAAAEKVAATQPTLQKASEFIGQAVRNGDGKDIGKVQDLVFDSEKGRIGYALLALNGADGKNGRIVPVPLSALKPGENGSLNLNMSETVLAAAGSVENDELPGIDAFAVGGAAQAESGSGSSDSSKAEAARQSGEKQNAQPQD